MATIPKEIRQEVNMLAHKLALLFEYNVRDSILAELKETSDTGADLYQLRQALTNIEATRSDSSHWRCCSNTFGGWRA